MESTDLPAKKDSENDSSLVHLEAVINLIPYAGGFLATYFSELRSRRLNERMERYFRYVNKRIAELDERKLDKDYLRSEHFAELFAQGAEHAARSTTEERIRRFANIIVNNALASPQARARTQGIMTLVDRLSDLDAFALLSFGSPEQPSLRAPTRTAAIALVRDLASYLRLEEPPEDHVAQSLIYMDNLGVTWVTQQALDHRATARTELVAEFSVFRTPLGDAVARAIAPPEFYKDPPPGDSEAQWPHDFVSDRHRRPLDRGEKDLLGL